MSNQRLADKFGLSVDLLNATKSVLLEGVSYQAKVKAHMAKKGIKSMSDMTADQKKAFFNELDAMHTAIKEEVEIAEAKVGDTVSYHHELKSAGVKVKKTGTVEKVEGDTIHVKEKDKYGVIRRQVKVGDLVKEETLDELNKDTLYSYKRKSEKDEDEAHKKLGKQIKSGDAPAANKTGKKILNRMAGQERAETRLNKEEVELTQEDLDFIASLNASDETVSEDFNDLDSFVLEDIQAFMQTEDFEQLDELGKETLGNYIKKRSHDVATQGAITRQHAVDSRAEKEKQGGYMTRSVRDLDAKADKAFTKGWKHRQNIAKAVDKLVKKS